MPKQKTRKSVIKRFKISKTGKITRGRNFTSHLNTKKSSKRLRRLGKMVKVQGQYEKRLKKALGIRKSNKAKTANKKGLKA